MKQWRLVILLLMLGLLVCGCGGKAKESLYEGGMKALSEGNYNGAIVHFKNALEADPNYLEARYGLGLAYLESGKLDHAEKEFLKVQMQNPYDVRVNLQLARIANFQNKPDEALAQLKTYMEKKPVDPDGYDQLGFSSELKGNPGEAVGYHRKALDLDPNRTSSRLALAKSLIAAGDLDGADQALDALLQTQPNQRAALYLKAQIEARRKDAEGVLQTYTQLATAYPGDTLARYKEASLRAERGEEDKARLTAEALVKDFPEKPEGYKLQGLLDIRDGKFEQAVGELQRANKIQPDIESHYLLGIAYASAGNPEMAISQFQIVLDHAPDFVQARLMLGDIFLRQKRPNEALAVAEKLLEKNPEDLMGLAMRADALLLKGEWEKALEVYDRITAKAPQNVGVLLRKGSVRIAHDQIAEGERDLKAALVVAPKSLDVRMALYALYMQTRRPEQAEAVLNEGLNGGKSDAVLYNVLARMRLRGRNPQEALEMLQKAKAADPAYVITYHNLASFDLAQNQMDKAIQEYKDALAVKPDDLRILLSLAALYDLQNKPAEALDALVRARQTGNPEAYMALARFYLKSGKVDEGLTVLEEALARNPEALPFLELKARVLASRHEANKVMDVLARMENINPGFGLVQRVQYFLSLKDFAKAQEAAEKLVAFSPDSAFSYLPLSAVNEAKGDGKNAEAILVKACGRDPKNAQALLSLAQLQMRLGESAAAKATFDKVLHLDAANVMAFTGKGMLLQRAGDIEGAVINYKEALQIQPELVPALNNLAVIYADQDGMQVQALNLSLSAFARDSNNPSVIDTLGYALIKNKRIDDAVRVLSRAETIDPKNSTVLYHLAMALKEQGHKDEAVAKLQVVLADTKSPEYAGAKALLKAIQGN